LGTGSNAGSISGNSEGVRLTAGGSITNSGTISSTGAAGADLGGAGNVTNNSGGSISGSWAGVYVNGGPWTVTNAGTMSGASYALDFASSNSANRLIVDPGAVFNGMVNGGTGTLELASGSGSIGAINSGSFNNFQALAVDTGGNWTLNGGNNNVANVTNNGALSIASWLDVSSAIDPSSTGQFDLQAGSFLEVASALGSQSVMDFLGNSELIVDNAGQFGTNVGTSSYAGPQLADFGSGDNVDIHNFANSGVALNFNQSNGLLQITNGANQVATLDFQTSSLGTGNFQAYGDGGGGIQIYRV
jgi:hypothetical protein